ncbi:MULTISPECIES: carboxymuconolactone decarboxylase family protein [unclassified Variovorax]|uniref:carboxymuconolactone decarboxylase family protein n=1 Tax=unclassified Variovorax TaxID=663243 RepID=UPI0025780DE4|nr:MULTISPECIES: carboxymuconolactone decarboxylase family protein [unclassified Variovorax]MDM0085872.1 carboxymuconolactone decarboxylase family protein [Variovorax sp. J22G40]MDM0145870.1 carboxymuconolactone decarboxylase family protein [Variovorax sp. J2P1-31]
MSQDTPERIDWTQSARMQALNALAPEPFAAFDKAVFAPGHLEPRIKELIAVAVTHVTQCESCLTLHVKNARRLGATEGEIAEALWVAAQLRAGGAIGQFGATLAALKQSG